MGKVLSAWFLLVLAGPALAAGNIDLLARTCNNCHGLNGVSVGTSMPSIGGLPKVYLANIMKDWKYDKRGAVTMNRIVKGLSDDENCEDCHGATGSDPDVGAPRLNGQWARYMALELEKYRDPEFRMTHRKMRKAARELKEGEVHPVAAYFGAQDK
jgi:cytochrome c553